jgi:hypothetical protein
MIRGVAIGGRAVLVVIGLATAVGGGVAQGGPPDVVAQSGATSPNGLPYSRFAGVGLGDAGEVVFVATTTGVFRRSGTDDAPVAQAVFPPGEAMAGGEIIGVGPPALAPNGCVLAIASFADGGAGLLRRCGDVVERLAGVGDGVGGRTLTALESSVVTNGSGYVAFQARLSDGNVALVRGGVGPLVAVAETGDASPAGGTISSLRLIGVRTTGTVGFAATVVDGRDGLFEGDGTAIRKVIVEGDPVQDGPLASIEGASMNPDGLLAFLGELDDADESRGVFRADARPPLPQVVLVVEVGDPAPDVRGGTFGRFPPSLVPSINAAGDVAFRVTLGGDATGAGIFVAEADGDVRKVVTTRDEQPPPVETTLTRLRDPVVADDGSVIVVSTPPNEGVGLFVWRAGVLAPLIRFGTPADVGDPATQMFRFVQPSAVATAEDAVFLGQHDVLVTVDASGSPRVVAQLGAASPVKGVFSEIDVPAAGEAGRVAFRGEVLGGKTGQAIFTDDGDGPSVVARAGRAAPGAGRFRDFPAAVTDSGGSVDVSGNRIGFLASLYDTRAFEGLFLRKRGAGGRSLARTNAKAPGGGRYVSLDVPSALDGKHYAFSGLVRDDATRQAIFWRDGGRTRIVARQALETGTRLGGRFAAFSRPDLGPDGLLFRADVSPGDRDGLFLAVDTRRGLLLGSGDPDDGADTFRAFDRPEWSGSHVVFSASLAGVPSLRGLYRLDPDGLPAPDAPPRPVETLLREGRPAPGGGTIVDVRPPAVNAAGALLTIVRVEGGPVQEILARIRLDDPVSP